MFFAKDLGQKGEKLAAQYYRRQGYEIEKMNFHTRQGEIDVIARKGNLLVFSEVKTRSENAIAAPREFVTYTKQQKIILAAKAYLVSCRDTESFVRFDVIEVVSSKGSFDIHCIENAFTL